MSSMDLKPLSKKLADIDFTMLQTHTDNGQIAGRPMSNNGEVEYQGDSYYFTWHQSRMVQDIQRDPRVALCFQANTGLLGKPGIMVHVEGNAELINDKAAFSQHWNAELDRWFKDGVDTPGVVMIKVHAARINYWDGEDNGEMVL